MAKGIKVYDAEQLLLNFDEPIYIRDTSSITEQAGYVDAETQVTRLIRAGVTYADFKRGMIKPQDYEFPDGEVPDDVKADPTLDVGFDMVDASAINDSLARKAKASKKEEAKSSEADDVADA